MFTDMVDFTARTQMDEAGSLRLLREQEELVRPLFEAHRGREVKSTGDGFLVEFPSALQATECAVAIQERLHRRNLAGAAVAIELRIGIHLGDVEERGEDIFGDAVNIAARVHPTADRGGIAISQQVFDQIRNKIALPFDELEPRQLKGLQAAMHVYRIRLPWSQPAPEGAPTPSEPSRIAVLPFVSMGKGRPADDFFADGMTEELIVRLSRVTGLRVIARTSAMHYKGTRSRISDIGRELQVGTVLEGSVRRSGPRIRVTAQLVNAATEEPIWSETFDRKLEDVFVIQDEVAARIAQALPGDLIPGRSARAAGVEPEHIEAYTLFLQAQHLATTRTPEGLHQALTLLQRATEIDPGFARAYAALADCHVWLCNIGQEAWADGVAAAWSPARTALELDPELPEAHAVAAEIAWMEDDFPTSQREASRAVELNPSLASSYHTLGLLNLILGHPKEGTRHLETASKLDPLRPESLLILGQMYIYFGREAEALALWERARPLAPMDVNRLLAYYYASKPDLASAETVARSMEGEAPRDPRTLDVLANLAAVRKDRSKVDELSASLAAVSPGGMLNLVLKGVLRFHLGDLDGFFVEMREAARTHTLNVFLLRYFPGMEALRSDPRYAEVFEISGLSPEIKN